MKKIIVLLTMFATIFTLSAQTEGQKIKSSDLIKKSEFSTTSPNITVVLDTDYSKEISIAFEKGQILKDHKVPQPIVVSVIEGSIVFNAEEESIVMPKGAIITISANIMHNLIANEKSIVHLSRSKYNEGKKVMD